MGSNLTIESLDFDRIRRGDMREAGDAIEFLWTVLNDLDRRQRRGVRLAVDRSERLALVLEPSAALDNYDIGDASILSFEGAASVNVTGLLAPSGGAARMVVILVLGAGTITVKHASANSDEPNRIQTAAAGDVAITTGRAAAFVYRSLRWRELKWM